MENDRDFAEDSLAFKISSEGLAAIIVDELVCAGIVAQSDAGKAIAITTEKIQGRKELGDY